MLLDTTPLRVNPSYRRLFTGFTLSGIGAQLAVGRDRAAGLRDQRHVVRGRSGRPVRARPAGGDGPVRRGARRRARPAAGRAGRGAGGLDGLDRQRGLRLAGAPDAVVALPRGGAAERGVRGDQPGPLVDLPAAAGPVAAAGGQRPQRVRHQPLPHRRSAAGRRAGGRGRLPAGLHLRRGAVHVRHVGACCGSSRSRRRSTPTRAPARRAAVRAWPACSTGCASSAPARTCG